MALSTVGDMRQFLLTSRHNTSLKTELNTLVQELTSGRAEDLTKHLGTSQQHLTGLDRQLELLDRFAQSNTETAQLLTVMQTALANMDDHRAVASGALLSVNASSTASQSEDAASVAESSFKASVQSLNMRSAGRAMFGGNDLDGNPLADPDAMFDALKLTIAGLTNATDVSTAIDTWFDAPAGAFETIGYLADANGVRARTLVEGQTVDIPVRADDQAVRDTLKALAKGALAADTGTSLTETDRRALQKQAGVELLAQAGSMASLQARLGHIEGQVQEATVRNAAQQTSLGIARNDLVSADPFETATRLQSVQLQLESHYTLTARLSRLSLTEYLR